MTDTSDSSDEPQTKPAMSLSDLAPAKAAVATSCGTLYVRHATLGDWKHFESDEAEDLGKAAVKILSSFIEDKKIKNRSVLAA